MNEPSHPLRILTDKCRSIKKPILLNKSEHNKIFVFDTHTKAVEIGCVPFKQVDENKLGVRNPLAVPVKEISDLYSPWSRKCL
jgi:hypothetical protein